MSCKVTPHNSFPKFLLMRTTQPDGTVVRLIKTKDVHTEEHLYWTFEGDTKDELARKIIFNKDENADIIGTYLFEAQYGLFELVEKPQINKDEAAERGAPSEEKKEPELSSYTRQHRYEYLKDNK